jgi:hypothetical protein
MFMLGGFADAAVSPGRGRPPDYTNEATQIKSHKMKLHKSVRAACPEQSRSDALVTEASFALYRILKG